MKSFLNIPFFSLLRENDYKNNLNLKEVKSTFKFCALTIKRIV